MMAKLREDYWIPQTRTVVKGVVRKCKTCIRLTARPSEPRMSDLPFPSLTSYAFIDGLRRFLARRGVPERLLSDNGTKFVGACRELGEALREVNAHLQFRGFILKNGISWSFNPHDTLRPSHV